MSKRKRKKPDKGFQKGKARRKLHDLWSYAVRTRDGFACQWCLHDDRKNVNHCHHAHHIVARSLSGTAGSFDMENGLTLCYHCHIDRIKSEPDEYIVFRDAWLAPRDYHKLRAQYQNKPTKFTESFYEQAVKSLQKFLETWRSPWDFRKDS